MIVPVLPRRRRAPVPVAPSGDVGALWFAPRGVDEARLSRADVAMFQQILMAMGYTQRGMMRADGVIGTNTRAAVRAFQTDMQPTRLRAETTPLGERARAFAARVGTLTIDGILGPETQRWLQWFAVPTASGGGGEGEDYARIPTASGITPSRVAQRGGLHVASVDPVTVAPSPPSSTEDPVPPPLVVLPGATTPVLPSVPAPLPETGTPTPSTNTAEASPPPSVPVQASSFVPPVASSGGAAVIALGVVGLAGWGLWRLGQRRR